MKIISVLTFLSLIPHPPFFTSVLSASFDAELFPRRIDLLSTLSWPSYSSLKRKNRAGTDLFRLFCCFCSFLEAAIGTFSSYPLQSRPCWVVAFYLPLHGKNRLISFFHSFCALCPVLQPRESAARYSHPKDSKQNSSAVPCKMWSTTSLQESNCFSDSLQSFLENSKSCSCLGLGAFQIIRSSCNPYNSNHFSVSISLY